MYFSPLYGSCYDNVGYFASGTPCSETKTLPDDLIPSSVSKIYFVDYACVASQKYQA